MDDIKTWFVEVILKNVGPKVVATVMSMFVAFLAAHQQIMQQMGITYYPNFNGSWSGVMPSGRLLVVEFDTLQVWGGIALMAGITALYSLIQHHTVATVKGMPQSGDMRTQPELPIIDGKRKDDLPKGA